MQPFAIAESPLDLVADVGVAWLHPKPPRVSHAHARHLAGSRGAVWVIAVLKPEFSCRPVWRFEVFAVMRGLVSPQVARICNNVTFSSERAMTSRFRLPKGFVRLKPEMGIVLRRLREAEGMTQAELARTVGLSRESLSRIERGLAVPRPLALDALLAELLSDWGAIAERGKTSRAAIYFDGSRQGDLREELGRNLRAGRRRARLSLRGLSALCGMSAAQLSRIERGEGVRSAAYEFDPSDTSVRARDQRQRFAHPVLARLAEAGK